jgi:hypothetical protein
MFKLELNTDHPDFGEREDQKRKKIESLLQRVAEVIGSGKEPEPLRSANGHVVGTYSLDGKFS